ncbi:MAG TPA: radical SAM protein [Acidimicrobiales bacterium]
MKVNLYYAPFPSQTFEGYDHPVNTERPLNPKSALPTLAAGIRQHGPALGLDCDVEIVDMQLGGERTWYKTIDYGPERLACHRLGTPFEACDDTIRSADVHGLTSNFTNGAQVVADLASHIKQVSPHSTVVAGGVDATARPRYYLDRGADIVVQGEADHVFPQVLRAVAAGEDLRTVPQVLTRDDPEPGHYRQASVLDMNALEPMALDLVGDLSLYTDTAEGPPPPGVEPNYICFETSRGCAWRCSFCTAPSRGRYRFMTPDVVDRHFRHFKEMGVNTIVWQEDNPLSRIQETVGGRAVHDEGREELLEIFRMARSHGFAWEFANGIEFGKFRVDGKIDVELMDALLWNEQTDGGWRGCYRVQIPLDNMNLAKLRFPKLLAFGEQLEVLSAMLDYGVAHQTYDLFIGYPEHSVEVVDQFTAGCLQIRDTLSRQSPATYRPYFNVFTLALLPGARDYETLRHLLAFDVDRDPEVIAIFLSAINTDHLSYWDAFCRRVEMTNRLNDGADIATYDGIYTGPASARIG